MFPEDPRHDAAQIQATTPSASCRECETAVPITSGVSKVGRALDIALSHQDLRRAADEPTPLAAAARLVVATDDREIRTQITGRRRVVTGCYSSRKAGRPLPFESMGERAFFMESEVDTNVVDYRAQPFRLEFTLDGRPRAYIADCLRLLDGGQLEVVEIKSDYRSLQDVDYGRKLKVVEQICRRLGMLFRTELSPDPESREHRWRNVQEVQLHKHVAFDAVESLLVLERLASGRSRSIGELIVSLGADPRRAFPILCAMMVQRLLRIDLNAPLTRDSSVFALGGVHLDVESDR